MAVISCQHDMADPQCSKAADAFAEFVLGPSGQSIIVGAAVLAGVGIGAYPDYPTALERVVAIGHEFPPDSRAHAAYNSLFPIYKELYPDVEPYFERLARLDLPQVWVTRGAG